MQPGDNDNYCWNYLKVYGNPLFVDPVRAVIEGVFPTFTEDDERPHDDAPPGKAVLVAKHIYTPEVPPVMEVIGLSRKLPELEFYLYYDNREMACLGSLEFKAGEITFDHHEDYHERVLATFWEERDRMAKEQAIAGASPDASSQGAVILVDPFITWLDERVQRARRWKADVCSRHAPEQAKQPLEALPPPSPV